MDVRAEFKSIITFDHQQLARKRAALPAALDFNIAKKKRDAMLIDIGPTKTSQSR